MVLIGRQRECVCVWVAACFRKTDEWGREEGGGGSYAGCKPSSFIRRTKPEVVSCGVKIRVSTEMGRK